MADTIEGRYTANHQPAKILMFPELITPVEGRDDKGAPTGKKHWKAEFLMAPADPDLEGLYKLAGMFYAQTHPTQWAQAKQLAQKEPGGLTYPNVYAYLATMLNVPFGRGTDRAKVLAEKGKRYGEAYNGKIIFTASKPELKRDGTPIPPPALCGIEGNRVVDYDSPDKLAMARGRFFSGAECFFEVMLSGYGAGRGGVKAYLNMVCVTGKGQKLAGAPSGAEKFGMHVGHVSAVNPLTDNEIPF